MCVFASYGSEEVRTPFLALYFAGAQSMDSRGATYVDVSWEGEDLDIMDDDAASAPVARHYVLVLVDNVVLYALPIGSGDGDVCVGSVCVHGETDTELVSCHSSRADCQPYGRCCGGRVRVWVQGPGEHELQVLLSASAEPRHAVLYRDKCVRALERVYVERYEGGKTPRSTASEIPLADRASHFGAKPAGAHAAKYSTHKCAGVDSNYLPCRGGRCAERALQDGSCVFQHVCFLDSVPVYMQHPNVSTSSATQVPRLHTCSRLWRADPREPMPVWEEIAFRVRRRSISASYQRSSVPLLYIRRTYAPNAGHVLADDAWAIFQAQTLKCICTVPVDISNRRTLIFENFCQGLVLFDMLDYQIQILIDDDQGPELGANYWSNKVFALVSGRPVLGRSVLRDMSICVDNFLTGWGYTFAKVLLVVTLFSTCTMGTDFLEFRLGVLASAQQTTSSSSRVNLLFGPRVPCSASGAASHGRTSSWPQTPEAAPGHQSLKSPLYSDSIYRKARALTFKNLR
jgi:hypothetical protein